MIDAAADGRAADALAQLDRLIAAGEEPHALLAADGLDAAAVRTRRAAVRTRRAAQAADHAARGPAASRRACRSSWATPSGSSGRSAGRGPGSFTAGCWPPTSRVKGYNSAKEPARRVVELLILRLSREAQGAATPTGAAP